MDDAGIVGRDDCLDPIAGAELAQDVRYMCLDCRVADDKRGRDLRIRKTSRDKTEYLCLPCGRTIYTQTVLCNRHGHAGRDVQNQPAHRVVGEAHAAV